MNETAVAETPRRQGSYTEAEITRALVEVAACSGNTHMAARNLAADDDAPSIPQQTLWAWSRRDRVEAYERIRAEALPEITAQAAEQHMHLARLQSDYATKAAELIADRMPKMEDKDLVNAMGKLDIGSGIHTEKAQLLSGQPTHRAENNVENLLRGLAARGLQLGEERQEADGSRVKRVAVLGPGESESESKAVDSGAEQKSEAVQSEAVAVSFGVSSSESVS